MGMFDKFKDMIGIEEYDEEEYDYEDEEYEYEDGEADSPSDAGEGASRSAGTVLPMRERKVKSVSGDMKLMIIEPEGFEECSTLVDGLKNSKPVIVNLEQLDTETARKIYDFLGGATYALNGTVKKVANNIYVFAPEAVDISTNIQAAPSSDKPSYLSGDEDYNPWR